MSPRVGEPRMIWSGRSPALWQGHGAWQAQEVPSRMCLGEGQGGYLPIYIPPVKTLWGECMVVPWQGNAKKSAHAVHSGGRVTAPLCGAPSRAGTQCSALYVI